MKLKLPRKKTSKAVAYMHFNPLICWFSPTCIYLAPQLIPKLNHPDKSFLACMLSLVFVHVVMPCPWDFDCFYMIVWVIWDFGLQNFLSFVLKGELQRTVAGKESICCHCTWIKPFIIWLLCSTEPWMKHRLRWHFVAHPRKQHVL